MKQHAERKSRERSELEQNRDLDTKHRENSLDAFNRNERSFKEKIGLRI